jgi:hypothetical protein
VGRTGAGTTILLWVASLLKLNVPPEVASALTLFIATRAGYTLRADGSASSRAPRPRDKAPSRSAAMAIAG